MIDIKKIKTAALDATPGEWFRYELEDYDQHIYAEHMPAEHWGDGEQFVRTICMMQSCETNNTIANATYIAAANPLAVLELIEMLEAAESRAKALEKGYTIVAHMYIEKIDINSDKQGDWPIKYIEQPRFCISKPKHINSTPLYTRN